MDPSVSSASNFKISQLQSVINENLSNGIFIPFIFITETWLKPFITRKQVKLHNYVCQRSDRIKRGRGGAMLYVHNSFPVIDVKSYDDDINEVVICTIPTDKIILACLYRPPESTLDSFTEAIKFISDYLNSLDDCFKYKVLILGDFNLPDVDWTQKNSSNLSQSSKTLLSFMGEFFLTQEVRIPTRIDNTLDLFITNTSNMIANVSTEETNMSDHLLVNILLTQSLKPIKKNHCIQDKSLSTKIDYSKLNFDEVNNELSKIDWQSLFDSYNIENFPEILNNTVTNICQKVYLSGDFSTKPPKNSLSPLQRRLKSLNRKKKRLQRKLNKVIVNRPNSQLSAKISQQIKQNQYEIKETIRENLQSEERTAIENLKTNPKSFYSYAKKKSKCNHNINMVLNKEKKIITDPVKIANEFQNHFKSVFSNPDAMDKQDPTFIGPVLQKPFTNLQFNQESIEKAIDQIRGNSSVPNGHISAQVLKKCKKNLSFPIFLLWQASYDKGYIPDSLKEQCIIPLHKKDSRVIVTNYRPISLTSHLIKIFERLIRDQLLNHFENNNIFTKNQHGFRKGFSCLSQLLAHYEDVLLNNLNGNGSDVIYLDYAKAFDKVDHDLLVKKLIAYGVKDKTLQWIINFLSRRKQKVVINGFNSFWTEVVSGVIQGSVLGPILFLIFVNDLEQCVQHSVVRCFADDTRLTKAIHDSQVDVGLLQSDLNSVIAWSTKNNMMLNELKFEILSYATKCKHIDMKEIPFFDQYSADNYKTSSSNTIDPSTSLRDLGMTVSNDYSWSPHILNIISKGNQMASWVLSIFKDRGRSHMLIMLKSFIRSHLEFCCPLWNPWKIEDIIALEQVQRTFTSKIHGLQHFDYWTRLQKLNLQSLQRRRERYIIIHMWKIFYNQVPNDLNIQFTYHDRKGISAKLKPLVNANGKAQTLYDNSFAVMGPRLWNLIPKQIQFINTTVDNFKCQLSKFLDLFPDQPPVNGYSRINNNSLLQWYPIMNSTNELSSKIQQLFA